MYILWVILYNTCNWENKLALTAAITPRNDAVKSTYCGVVRSFTALETAM